MIVLAFDPSGNYNEGKGTTGYAVMVDGVFQDVGEIKASDFSSAEEYWHQHIIKMGTFDIQHLVFEGYRLYNHAGQEANKQANSELETPQLIGVLRYACHSFNIPYTIQSASQVKTRWSDKVLQANGILDFKNKWNGSMTNTHKRDAMRHALHFNRYGRK